MATITGKLETIAQSGVEIGSIEVALCGYGPQVPRSPTALLARIAQIVIPGSDGTFTATVPGNDTIAPEGTYYTVTVKNSNGDIVQVNAYLFLSGNTYDLDVTDPFDPSQPLPPLPPLIINQLQVLANSNSFVFDGQNFTGFKAVLNQDATINVTGAEPGNLYTFINVQDATGKRVVTWGTNFYNMTPVNPDPNSTTVQTCVLDDAYNFYAISAATWYTP